MPLHIYSSDKIEDLAGHLKAELVEERKKSDPFSFSTVVVPNRNISRWLQISVFSGIPELCAGVRFPFMEKRLTDLLLRNLSLPEGASFSPIPDNGYANAVMAALLAPASHPGFADFAPFRRYVAGEEGAGRPLDVSTQRSARMAWQLAARLADLMDQYEVRRPEIVRNWLAGKNADGTGAPPPGSTEAGEAALARALWGRDGTFPDDGERLSLRQLYDRVENDRPNGPPETLFFFGMSTLSILQAKILVWLAKTHKVVFYHNNVCLEYWGDIETKSERVKRLGRSHAGDEDIAVENPLLSQWGAAGRETMRLLVDLEEQNDGSIGFEWKCLADRRRPQPGTLLGRIQDSIRRRTGETGKLPQDASLQIVGAPGVRREVEMVYNAILGAVWKPEGSGERPWGECDFSDIAVLVPDMATYRSVIEAVFDARDGIPFGLVDTTASEDSAYLAGFLALADLGRRGLTRETLFALLDNPCVQAALSFTPDDVADWRDVAARIGAFDGFEAREGESFTDWDWALSRLRLATVADAVTRDRDAQSPEPVPLAPVNDRAVLRLSEIVELLHRRVEETFRDAKADAPPSSAQPAPRRLACGPKPDEPQGSESPNWRRALSQLAREFLAVPKGDDGKADELEDSVRRQVLKTIAGLAGLPGSQTAELAIAAVEHFAGGLPCRRGGYLTDGVTIASLQPMRPVPFRQVFVLGLGEGGFPGRTGAVDMLDVRGAGWKLGDVSLPKMNRFLFLETLMAVRDRLVLSYPNRDIKKDAELFPSGIVRELESFAGLIAEAGAFEEFAGYPLLERGERSVKPSPVCDVAWSKEDPFAGLLPTYSETARRTAAALAGVEPVPVPSPGKAAPAAVSVPAKAAPAAVSAGGARARREVSAKELAEFLKEPLHAALHFGFGVAEKGARDVELDTDAPLGVPDGPVKWGLQADWLAGEGDLEGAFRRLQLGGKTPTGFLGDFARERFAEKVAESREAMLAFAKGFGLGTDSCATMRQGFPAALPRGAGEPGADVLFVSATPNWRENGNDASVLVAGFLGENPPRLPPEATLAPFVAFLMRAAKEGPGGGARTLRVGVADVEHGTTAVWRWAVDSATACDWLERFAIRYLDYLDRPDADGRYADFTYRKLVRALEEDEAGHIDWEAVLDRLTREEFKPKRGGNAPAPAKRYDGGLVVEQTVGTFRRDPSAAELAGLYDEFYRLPLSGEREDLAATKGDAQ